MGIPRTIAEGPLFYLPVNSRTTNLDREYLGYPNLKTDGYSSPLFVKGRSCLAFVLSIIKNTNKNQEKNEIIIPAYNARSLAFAAINTNLKIKLVDINTEWFFPSYEQILKCVSKNTLAIVLPYNWGIFPPLEEITKIHKLCTDEKIFPIDDFATSVPGDLLYLDFFKKNSFCHLYSFGKTKVTSFTDGGFAFFPSQNPWFSQTSDELKNYKFDQESDFKTLIKKNLQQIVYNLYSNKYISSILFFLNLAQKNIQPTNVFVENKTLSPKWHNLLYKIINKGFKKNSECRLKNSNFYIAQAKITEKINFKENIKYFPSTSINIGSRFPLLVNPKLRSQIVNKLNENHIGVSTGHDSWLGGLPFLVEHMGSFDKNNFPNAIEFEKSIINLPNHYKVSQNEILKIIDILGI